MKALYVDPVGGLAGDMLLGAFLDLGWSLDRLRGELTALGLTDIRVSDETRTHNGLATRGVVVEATETTVHRTIREIEEILGSGGGEMPPHRSRALAVFRRLVEAEAKVHGRPPEEVHLHEVGAQDAIADIVGTCLAVADLGIGRIIAGPPTLGSGVTGSSHGPIPLPAPATVEILRGVPVRWTAEPGEKVTPTGAALVTVLADRFGPPEAMTIAGVGWGGGTRPSAPGAPPNAVRLVLGEIEQAPAPGGTWEAIAVLECEIDDMTPQEMSELGRSLLEAGALDFFLAQGVMKKGRPGWSLRVLAVPGREPVLRDVLLSRSTTLGIRSRLESRVVLDRRQGTVETPYGAVAVKWVRTPAGWSARPEFDSVRSAAAASGVSMRVVAEAARIAASGEMGQGTHSGA